MENIYALLGCTLLYVIWLLDLVNGITYEYIIFTHTLFSEKDNINT